MLLWNPVLQRLGLKPVDTSTKRTQNDGPWASGRFGAFQWCEALSLGVPKPSAPLRDNLWSDVPSGRPFLNSTPVPKAVLPNRLP